MAVDRRALLRRLIGFSVGFVVALTVVVATDFSRGDSEPATGVIGTPDVFEYCRSSEFELEAALGTQDADGWRCVGRRNGIWGIDVVDVDDVCRQQYGPSARSRAGDPDSPDAWECVAGAD